MLLLDDDRLDAFRTILRKEERRIYDLLVKMFSGKQTYRDMHLALGRIEGFLAIFWYVNRLRLQAKSNVNWRYSMGEILSELCERVKGRANLQRGEQFYDGLGVLHRVCMCGNTFQVAKSEYCQACQEKRRRSETVKSIERFIEKRKLIGR